MIAWYEEYDGKADDFGELHIVKDAQQRWPKSECDPGAPLITAYVYKAGKLLCVQEYRRSYMTNIPAWMWRKR